MVIGNLNLEGIAITPYEADSVLVVDPDAALSCPVTLERFQSIAGENRQIREQKSNMDLYELSLNDLRNPVEALCIASMKNQLGISGSERSNHRFIL
jgi:hypothetical protein